MRRLEAARLNKTEPWVIDDLEKVLSYLKKNKSRDPHGYANELFRPEVAGKDLKLAILKLMNKIKTDQAFPKEMELCDISSVYKRKGCRNSFNSYRGIFRVSFLRCILDRLIYNDEYEIIDNNLTDSNVGARKGRNIRDNIFVLNAISNSVLKGQEEDVDIQVFDIEKCFDALWAQECINDIYDAGLTNDKLPLLFLENMNAQCAVKVNNCKSKRIDIKNTIMQGTVWGSLFCTATMDKLGKLVYKDKELVYKYKGVVDTPCLGMVDDILSIQRCSNKSVKTNSVINAFVELKKLKFSETKCHRIHLGKPNRNPSNCPELKVHTEVMKNSAKEKYLGDIISNKGTIKATIEERKAKGYATVAEILAILKDIPLGQHKLEIGLQLRQAMFLNGVLFNSEAWHDVSDDDLKALETIDEHLLRSLVDGHAKAPLEFLYLEAGVPAIRHLVSCRRLLYLQTILKRPEEELTYRVLMAQKDDPSPGDFINLVYNDIRDLEMNIDVEQIKQMGIEPFKNLVKKKTRNAAFKHLLSLQAKHSKIRNIQYNSLQCQPYMLSSIFTNDEVNLLHSLRSRSTNCKINFRGLYGDDLSCPLCDDGSQDDQPHLLKCQRLRQLMKSDDVARSNVKYNDIFGSIYKQKEVTVIFCKLFDIRKKLIDEQASNVSVS